MNPFTIGILIMVCLLTMSLAAGAVAKARLRKQYPPTGQRIDMGGYRMHLETQGQPQAGPTVVLDAGVGGFGAQWALVQPTVAQFARVGSYDRAGYGWSDPGRQPRTAAVLADELYTLLHMARLPQPYILVGHSLGGVVAREMAQRHPAVVAGMVLVDSAHEQQYQRFPQELVKMLRSMKTMFGIVQLLNRIGIQALNPKMVIGDEAGPRLLVNTCRALIAMNSHHFPTAQAEADAALQSQSAPAPLGDLPLVVLSHGLPQDLPMAGPEVNQAYERAWQAMQAELAALSSRGKRIIAEGSGHNIHIEQPQLVINAIREVLGLTSTLVPEVGSIAERQ